MVMVYDATNPEKVNRHLVMVWLQPTFLVGWVEPGSGSMGFATLNPSYERKGLNDGVGRGETHHVW